MVWFCSENRGKFDQIILQLDHWVDRINGSIQNRSDGLVRLTIDVPQEDVEVCVTAAYRCSTVRRLRVLRAPVDVLRAMGPEPQCSSCEEIARLKVLQAAEAANAALLIRKDAESCDNVVGVAVQDSGLSIRALQDFPGPYTKYVTQTLGMRGILKLMEGVADRACGFDGCLGYCAMSSPAREPRLFREPRKYWGRLATWAESGFMAEDDASNSCVPAPAASKWTVGCDTDGKPAGDDKNRNAFSVFIPEDVNGCSPEESVALMRMGPDALRQYRRARHSCYRDYVEFLLENVLGLGPLASL